MREIILDTETTGLNPRTGDRIVEIGALEMVNKVLTGEKFHVYINPERDMPEAAYRVHGISSEFLADKPLFKEIADDFMNFVKNDKMVIHNAPFDIKFLNHELSLLGMPSFDLAEATDTLVIARRKFPGARVNLDALCRRYKVDNSSRQFHGALKDSALLAEVYVELTGGRQTKFSMESKKENVESNINETIVARGSGVVIKPTEKEKKYHKEFIKELID